MLLEKYRIFGLPSLNCPVRNSMITQLQILLVEDNPADSRLLQEFLSEQKKMEYNLIKTETLAEASAYLNHNTVDLVLLDLGLPDTQGLNTFKSLIHYSKNIPVVILTGLQDEDLAITMVRMGAQDYLSKGNFDASFSL